MRVAIVGPGLIGRSISRALAHADSSIDVVEIDRDRSLEAAQRADVIVLATPVDVIIELIRTHADQLRAPLVIDVGSTKRAIVIAASECGLTTFIGGHPMAGGATSGPNDARPDLFVDRPFFLVPHTASTDALTLATTLVHRLGARPIVMADDGREHDEAMAAVSHLPQLVASALMALVAGEASQYLQWAGNGLGDTTRLAGSRADVWQAITDTNAAALKPLVQHLAQDLMRLADQLGDRHSVSALFERANRGRDMLREKALR